MSTRANPPPLVSPVPGLPVRAVLDQDAVLTAGLAVDADGRRAVLLMGAARARPGEREEFTEWAGALERIGAVARTAKVADYGHTGDGRSYLATYTDRSLVDMMRRVGPPERRYVRDIGVTVADALAATHSYGLVHGAVGPATVLLVSDGVRLGGFGATAPGLSGPLGVWAFTAPEHRAAAAAGDPVGSPAGDVFALAATICVAFAGVLPWSDPVSWADAADVPSGPHAPGWAVAIRAALSADPDQRPTAEHMADALRTPATGGSAAALVAHTIVKQPAAPRNSTVPMNATMAHAVATGLVDPADLDGPTVKVDLRGLIPRQVRRLAANSIDAMADGPTSVTGRAAMTDELAEERTTAIVMPAAAAPATDPAGAEAATPAVTPGGAPTGRGPRRLLRTHRRAVGVLVTVVALAIASVIYFSGGPRPGNASAPPTATTGGSPGTLTVGMLDGARLAGQSFLHNVGVRSDVACIDVHGDKVITVGGPGEQITCAALLANAKGLLGQATLDKMSKAKVLQAVSYPTGDPADPDPHAFISLAYTPSLKKVLNKLEMVLTFHADQWWIVQVDFA